MMCYAGVPSWSSTRPPEGGEAAEGGEGGEAAAIAEGEEEAGTGMTETGMMEEGTEIGTGRGAGAATGTIAATTGDDKIALDLCVYAGPVHRLLHIMIMAMTVFLIDRHDHHLRHLHHVLMSLVGFRDYDRRRSRSRDRDYRRDDRDRDYDRRRDDRDRRRNSRSRSRGRRY